MFRTLFLATEGVPPSPSFLTFSMWFDPNYHQLSPVPSITYKMPFAQLFCFEIDAFSWGVYTPHSCAMERTGLILG